MTITVELRTLGGNPASASTLIGSQALAAPAAWTKLTTLGSVTRGGLIRASSDAEPFRIYIGDPIESSNPNGPALDPRNSGVLIPWPNGQVFEEIHPPNGSVWVKQA